MDPLILDLDSPDATLERVGGKGASLARMVAAGLPVPPGFHITTHAYRRFVLQNDLQPAILEAAHLAALDPSSIENVSARIQARFAAAPMPPGIALEVRLAYAALGNGEEAVAVRSSATAEDLPELSFAGQHESYLNVQGEDALLAAIQRCWASLWLPRALAYRIRNGVASDQVSLAVVVQQLVPADAAGILFGAHPVTGDRDQVLINAAWGLGEAIVGGAVTPDSFTVDKTSAEILAEEVADKATMTVRAANGAAAGTTEQPVPAEKRNRPSIDAGQVKQLAALARRIEELYGQPMDVEWAIHDGHIAILQARPITALPEPSPKQLEWPLPRPGGRYARGSVTELLPDPLSPLFATLGLESWNASMGKFGEQLGAGELFGAFRIVTINDYAYYDFGMTAAEVARFGVGLVRTMKNLAPVFLRAEQRWADEAHPVYAAIVDRWSLDGTQDLPAVTLLEGIRDIIQVAAQYYVTVQSGILPLAYISETLFTAVYDRLIRRPGDPPALTFLLGYDSQPIRTEKSLHDLAEWARTREPLAEHVRGTASTDILTACRAPELAPDHLGDAWAEFCARLAGHLARFGHTIYDLDIAKPTPADEPGPTVDALKFMLGPIAASPYQRQAAAAHAREQAVEQTVARLAAPRLALFRRTLRWAQRYAPLREDALSDVGLGWPALRRMVQEIGRRMAEAGGLDAAGDVYWLRADELEMAARALDAGRPLTDHRPLVASRRATWAAERAVTPPLALPRGQANKFLGIDWTSMASARPDQDEGDTLRGAGTSPGQVIAVGRVIHGPEEFSQLGQGEVLVAKITTPAWTPLFMLAGGVVTDVGGPLSHGSIVAREYHIPAVMGTGMATGRIHSGDELAVDGDAGTVTIVQPGVPWRWPALAAPARREKPRRELLFPLIAGLAFLGGLFVAVRLMRRKKR